MKPPPPDVRPQSAAQAKAASQGSESIPRPSAEPTQEVRVFDGGHSPTPPGPAARPAARSSSGHTGNSGNTVDDIRRPPPIRHSTGPVGYPPDPSVNDTANRPATTSGQHTTTSPEQGLGQSSGPYGLGPPSTVTPASIGLSDDSFHEPILDPIEQFDVENAARYNAGNDETSAAMTGRKLAAIGVVLLLIVGGIAFVARFRSGSDEALDGGPSVDLLARSTVQIVGLDGNGVPVCSGSGTLVSSDGMILTNAHVVSRDAVCDFESLGIAMTSDSSRPPDLLYGADLLAVDARLDLAVIMVGPPLADGVTGLTTFPAMTLGDSDQLHIGDDLRIFGYPEIGGETITFTNGSVSGFTAQAGIGDRALIKTDATIAGGNSGGAAVDLSGALIGIPTKARASESGPAVDCRPLADTNSDGQVDDADNCVPIGGFLNGLRPINLAKPIIEQAASAAPRAIEPARPDVAVDFDGVRVSRPRFSIGESENAPIDVVRTAQSGIDELCLFVDWEGIPNGAEWDGLWYHDKELVDDFSLVRRHWDFGEVGNNFWMCAIDGDDGLDAGLYEVGFFLAGELVFAEGIVLTEVSASVYATTWENTTEVDICAVAVNPLGSGPAGLNELDPGVVIKPGQSAKIDLAAGPSVVEASDCDGEVVADSGDTFIDIIEEHAYVIGAPDPDSGDQGEVEE